MPSYVQQQKMRRVRVCHIAMGDLWAGAEVQLAALVCDQVRRPEIEVSVVLFNEGRLASELRALKVQVTILPEIHWNGTKLIRELIRYCRKNKFDIVHTHKYKDNILGTIAAVRCGVPHIVRTVHGLSEPFRGIQALRMGVLQFIDNLIIRMFASRLIAVSSEIEQLLAATYGPRKVVRIHNGVRLSQVHTTKMVNETRQVLGVDPVCHLIGTVGRLTAVKGQESFLVAAQLLLKKRRDLHFLVVGDGPLSGRLQSRAKEFGIDNRLTFLGHRDDTYDLMRAMDIFVLPSLHEGIPMVILEAMALARPIVASRVGGIPEVLTDQVHGLLVTAGSPTELSNACEKFLENSAFAERCGQAGQLRVEKEFSSDSMGEKVSTLYRELVARAA
jgi:glycosyltransferase involved in cell wall biosynthesis